MDKNIENFINSPQFKNALESYMNNKDSSDNEYIGQLKEMNENGIKMMDIVKQRFPIDEIIQLMNYNYNKIDKNSQHCKLLKEWTNYSKL